MGPLEADKSTCAHLPARFWDPSEGAVQLIPDDDEPMDTRDLTDARLRGAVAV